MVATRVPARIRKDKLVICSLLTFTILRVTLFEGSDLFSDNLEGWYDVNIWSLIVDHCLQNLEGMKTVRYALGQCL